MIVEGYIEFAVGMFEDTILQGAITSSSYPNTKTGVIYYSSNYAYPGNYPGKLFYKFPNANWTLRAQPFEDPGFQRFLWLTDYDMNTAPQLMPEELDAVALEKYEVMPLSTDTQYYWSLYNPATPLSTPTGLNATNITSDSARVSWTAVENASGYKVEYRQAAGGGQTFPWVEASD